MRILISVLLLTIAGATSGPLHAKNLTKRKLDAYLATRIDFEHRRIRVDDAVRALLGPLGEPLAYPGSLPADRIIGPFSLRSRSISEVLEAVLKAADNKHSLQWDPTMRYVSIELKPEISAELARRAHETQLREQAKRTAFRIRLAARLRMADRAEVVLLDPSMAPAPKDETMLVKPYKKAAAVVSKRTLRDDERTTLVGALCDVLTQRNPGLGMMCHYPIHGLRLFRNRSIVFESTFCWVCENYYLDYGEGASWTGIHGTALRTAFSAVMPVPKTRAARQARGVEQPTGAVFIAPKTPPTR